MCMLQKVVLLLTICLVSGNVVLLPPIGAKLSGPTFGAKTFSDLQILNEFKHIRNYFKDHLKGEHKGRQHNRHRIVLIINFKHSKIVLSQKYVPIMGCNLHLINSVIKTYIKVIERNKRLQNYLTLRFL